MPAAATGVSDEQPALAQEHVDREARMRPREREEQMVHVCLLHSVAPRVDRGAGVRELERRAEGPDPEREQREQADDAAGGKGEQPLRARSLAAA